MKSITFILSKTSLNVLGMVTRVDCHLYCTMWDREGTGPRKPTAVSPVRESEKVKNHWIDGKVGRFRSQRLLWRRIRILCGTWVFDGSLLLSPCHGRVLVMVWSSIQGVIPLTLIRTNKTSTVEETMAGIEL